MNSVKHFFKKIFQKITKSSAAVEVISSAIYLYARLVGKTTRWQRCGLDNFYKLWNDNQGLILVAWHGRALMLPYFWNKEKELNALVSLHRDGRMIAGLLQRFGLGTIGGSSNENASGAALELMRSLKHDTSICIIPDGPRGPRMQMNKSPFFYSQKTGKPLIGISYSVAPAKLMNKAWDKMMIPLPFGRGIVKVSEPMFIPADASPEQLEDYRRRFEKQLVDISIECDKKLGLEPVRPDINSRKIKRDERNGNVH